MQKLYLNIHLFSILMGYLFLILFYHFYIYLHVVGNLSSMDFGILGTPITNPLMSTEEQLYFKLLEEC
jgi:hypothetical protein